MAKTPSLFLIPLLPLRERQFIWRRCWSCCKSPRSHLLSPDLHLSGTDTLCLSYAIYASLGIFVFHREHSRAKQRKWIGAQKRASLLKRRSEDEEEGLATAAAAAAKSKEDIEREATPMLESRASLVQSRGKTVTWG